MVCLGFEPGAGAMAAHTRIAAHLGSGSVGKAVASYNRGLGFESSHRHNFTEHWLTVTVLKIQKDAGMTHENFSVHTFLTMRLYVAFTLQLTDWADQFVNSFNHCVPCLLVLKCRFGVKDVHRFIFARSCDYSTWKCDEVDIEFWWNVVWFDTSVEATVCSCIYCKACTQLCTSWVGGNEIVICTHFWQGKGKLSSQILSQRTA